MDIETLIEFITLNDPKKIDKDLGEEWRYQYRSLNVDLLENHTYKWFRDRKINKDVRFEEIETLTLFPTPLRNGAIYFTSPSENFYNETENFLISERYTKLKELKTEYSLIKLYLNNDFYIKLAKVNKQVVVIIINRKDFDKGFDIN